MIKNKKIFAEIEEYPGIDIYPFYYKVKFITEWDVTFFGKVIKHNKEIESVPLLFKTKSVAEDYCSMHPYLITDVFVNNINSKYVKYHTYRVLQNKKIIGFIKWDDNVIKTYENDSGMEFKPTANMVDMFAEDILVNQWIHTNNVKNVRYVFPEDYLSKLRTAKNHDIQNKAINRWKFQLVEE